jgi:hypothetical protein
MQLIITYLAVGIILLVTTVPVLCVSKSYDLNLRNAFSMALGGTAGFAIGLRIWNYSVDNGVVAYSTSGILILSGIIGGIIIGCLIGLVVIGEKNYYAEKRDKD